MPGPVVAKGCLKGASEGVRMPVMARIGVLIRELGDEKWKTREQASTQLKELGALARPSLQEALKQSAAAEATRRIEELLQSIE